MSATKIYTEKLFDKVQKLKLGKSNTIFVLQGQADLIELAQFGDMVTELESFTREDNESFFNTAWLTNFFIALNVPKEYHLISYPQFVYLIHHFNTDFFKDRVIILKDNLRVLFPLNEPRFISETSGVDEFEERAPIIPIYMAEQLVIGDSFYYSIKSSISDFKAMDLFDFKTPLSPTLDESLPNINLGSDLFGLDVFINQVFEEANFSIKAVVNIPPKQPNSDKLTHLAELLNGFLSEFGGEIFLKQTSFISVDFVPKPETLSLLEHYWGGHASFKKISIYKNPDRENELLEVSQGHFVETIINEYEKSKSGQKCKDFYLTAPTGAGKSLLFQLPAFHVSLKGDVTIVVSPLIALMKDQVRAILSDRGFEKVAYLNSELTLVDRDKIIESCKAGEIDILYMSPELLLSYDIKYFLGERRLGLLVIDEAHLITTWGRDFRVDYWFLGNHIWKMRKHHEMNFPMVAVTATAIFGGDNDMVFDSMDSLAMNDPHIFIGQVKRTDISFIINNHDRFTQNYDANKIKQTVDFIKNVDQLGFKTLVYAPYTSHIRRIIGELAGKDLQVATSYYGSLPSDLKELAYEEFKNGEKKVMVCTKAFGMGVDISNIQVIYHHAPSGLLPDYVQEIGRAARDPEIDGFAILNYSSQDQRYSKALHGMSSIKLFQLREVLKKINNTFVKNGKNRNLLLSVDDFSHIFQSATDDLDQKVLTSLMMIEKDYLAKNRFNVIVARPKKLFVKVFAKVKSNDLEKLSRIYGSHFKILSSDISKDSKVVEVDLDKLWYDHFGTKSFPMIKKEFYENKLFAAQKIEFNPQLRISIGLNGDIKTIISAFSETLEKLKNVFASRNKFFTVDEFSMDLKAVFSDSDKAKKLAKFILSSYSGRMIQPGFIEPNAFLQEKKNFDELTYRVFNNQYLQNFETLKRKLSKMFEGIEVPISDRYISSKGQDSINYTRLGSILEIMDLGTFEIKGGEKPMVFLRVNDPARITRDAFNPAYSNTLLKKTLERHKISNEIFDHFFLRSFSNEERWNFIESFFLGSSMDDLLDQFPGEGTNQLNVIEELGRSIPSESKDDSNEAKGFGIHKFHPKGGGIYYENQLLTINVEGQDVTKKITAWISDDPVRLNEAITQFDFKIHGAQYSILKSKLLANHEDYMKKKLGLSFLIEFKGYDGYVQAKIPYIDKPVEFYKWWCELPDKVFLSFSDKISLFNKVYEINKGALKKEHRDKLEGKS